MNSKAILDELLVLSGADAILEREGAADALRLLRDLREAGADGIPDAITAELADLVGVAERAVEDESEREGLRDALQTLAWSVTGPSSDVSDVEDDGDIDADLLAMFIASSAEGLADLEATLIAADVDDAEPEALDEARRAIHTIKGECGVLSLDAAQALWHEAETRIEEAIEASTPIPTDALLAVLEWHRDYLEHLGADPHAAPPPTGAVDALLAADDAAPAEPEPPATPDAPEEAPTMSSSAATPEADDAAEPVAFDAGVLDDETIPEFLTEAMAHLEESEAALLELENDPGSSEEIDRIFRAFHTIKGVAGFLDLTPICDLAHSTETLLDRFRGTALRFEAGHADVVLASKDMMERLLGALTGGDPPTRGALTSLIARVDRIAAAPDQAAGLAIETVRSTLADAGFESDEDLELARQDPTEAAQRLGDILVAQGRASADQIAAALTKQAEMQREGTPLRLGEVLVLLGVVSETQVTEALEAQGGSSPIGEVLKTAAKPQAAAPTKTVQLDTTIRVSTHRLDALVDMVGELVIAQQMVVQDSTAGASRVTERLERNLSHLGKITRDLQEASMSLRMITFRSTFQKMNRLVRDVSSRAGKKAKLVIEGADTEVDRNIVDKISDPLVHLVRNAIDHGLEGPEERVAAGKTPHGNVTLSARHQGGAIVISLEDDGRGLSRDKILAKAVERDLLPPDFDPREMSDAAVHKLIFRPGFSTAAAVTDISGRGVGMDVVKRNIESMRGKIDILSQEGQGTTFQIQLPLTLAIIDAMVVRSGDCRYVIPTLSIVQSFRPTRETLHALYGEAPMVEVRGELVPVQHIEAALGNDVPDHDPVDCTLILVEAMGRRMCLIVDEILGQQQVVIKKLGDCMPSIPVVSGGAILGDGRVALIVDVEGTLAESSTDGAMLV